MLKMTAMQHSAIDSLGSIQSNLVYGLSRSRAIRKLKGYKRTRMLAEYGRTVIAERTACIVTVDAATAVARRLVGADCCNAQ
ncbi:hypothetical protein ACS8Y6_07180 [Salinisphaera sp. RV14]|uniref:hypothetical protein n=1 Tax=unclassified Salinisphaera TaxID=2649847 RepID=UPI003F8326CA